MFNIPVDHDVHDEHLAIFRAALDRNEEAAREAVANHVRATYEVLVGLNKDAADESLS